MEKSRDKKRWLSPEGSYRLPAAEARQITPSRNETNVGAHSRFGIVAEAAEARLASRAAMAYVLNRARILRSMTSTRPSGTLGTAASLHHPRRTKSQNS